MSWDDVRFLLEYKAGMHSFPKQKKASIQLGHSCYEGRLWINHMTNWRQQAELIKPNYVLQPRDRVILVRRPLKRGERPYAPLRFQQQLETTLWEQQSRGRTSDVHRPQVLPPASLTTFTADMTEEQKIAYLMQVQNMRLTTNKTSHHSDMERRKLHRGLQNIYGAFHPTDVIHTPSLLQPPSDYKCNRCGSSEHYKDRCPTWDDPTHVPLRQRTCPTGIPKSFLRLAETEEEKKHAWITTDGQYVLLKKRIIK